MRRPTKGRAQMIRLTLEAVSLDFPVYQSSSRSIRKFALRTGVGGRISIGPSAVPVVQALRDINLDLKPGDRLGLVGHNGAGKTTLLRVLAGIYHPLVGTVRCQGKRMPLTDIQVGYDDEATGYEMILLRGLLMGLTRAEIEARVAEIAEFSELGDFLELPIRTYSSGMILRLFFSIATSIQADILLMDEWIAAGDEAFIKKANERLQSVVDRARILVIASHSRDLLSRLCTRGLLLAAGRVVCDGSLEDAFRAYDRLQHAA
jgi:ABC-type polysaccharide/polyol phosphate transport system ATPase subunit